MRKADNTGASAPLLPSCGVQEADIILQYWLTDSAAMMRMRELLYRSGQWPAVHNYTPHRVVTEVARLWEAGHFTATTPQGGTMRGGWPMAASASASSASSMMGGLSSVSSLVSLNSIAMPSLPQIPLLPVLEEVQMEGAEVLPEIEQALDNIESTMGNVDTASVSLTPAPSKVPEIQTAMTNASSNITATLNAL